jgi:hypothetical protein
MRDRGLPRSFKTAACNDVGVTASDQTAVRRGRRASLSVARGNCSAIIPYDKSSHDTAYALPMRRNQPSCELGR